jgi:hypothetical protein
MIKLRRRHAVGACLATAAISSFIGVARAQSVNSQPPISLSAEVRYDSNVSRISPAQAEARGLVAADQRFVPSVNLNISRRVGVFDLALNGSAGYVFYRRNTRLNRERIGLDGTLGASFSRCRVNVKSGIHRNQSDLADIAFIIDDATEREIVRNIENRLNYGFEANCGGQIGLRPTIGVQRETATNSAVRRSFNNFDRTDFLVGVSYVRPAFGELALIGQYEIANYPNRPRLPNGDADGFVSKSMSLKFNRSIGANLQGSVSVGYTNLDPRRAGVAGFAGLIGSANLSATLADRLKLVLIFTRDTLPSLQADAAYRVGNSVALNSTLAISQRLTLKSGVSYRTRSLVGSGTQPGATPLTSDQRLEATASVGFRFNDRLGLSLDGLYDKRKSALALYNSDNVGVGFNVNLAI